jgi:hypothetical protein
VGKFKPKQAPYKPHFWDLVGKRKKRGFHIQHPSWANYLESSIDRAFGSCYNIHIHNTQD